VLCSCIIVHIVDLIILCVLFCLGLVVVVSYMQLMLPPREVGDDELLFVKVTS